MSERLSNDLASLRITQEENPDARSGWRLPVIAVVVVAVLVSIAWALLGSLRGRFVAREVEVTHVRFVSASTSLTTEPNSRAGRCKPGSAQWPACSMRR